MRTKPEVLRSNPSYRTILMHVFHHTIECQEETLLAAMNPRLNVKPNIEPIIKTRAEKSVPLHGKLNFKRTGNTRST